ncbi:MAG: amidohydrolase family protein [Alphaproteobacteria bacterium]|nr:amidohydrolase family protein [Alphaproteobacteria bacterium]
MAGTNADWIALGQEDALEPELPICDPHHHLWEFRADQPEPRYLLDDLLADTNSGHNIVSTIFIECGAMYKQEGPEALRPVGETEFVNGIAAMSASGGYGPTRVAAGIVGHANLLLGDDVAPVLEAQIEAGGGRFRGIRHSVPWDASDDVPVVRGKRPPHLLIDDTYRSGFAHLARFGLTYEAWLYHPQLPELIDLARAFPDTTIILNHFGGPLGVGPYAGRQDEIFETWRADIAELAACANVVAKLGGLNMEINGFGWHDHPKPPTSEALMAATRAWYEYTIEQFGVERCLFESNFPVDKLSCGYAVLWNAFKRLTAGYSDAEKALLYHDTAARVYLLAAP